MDACQTQADQLSLPREDQGPGQLEHERKFVVTDLAVVLRRPTGRREIEQGYLFAASGWSVRVRLEWDEGMDDDPLASATFKGPWQGVTRPEVPVNNFPVPWARELLALCPGKIRKTRYWGMDGTWIVDVFGDRNVGLVVAEIEGSPDEVRRIEAPAWAAREVTHIDRHANHNLAIRPYDEWSNDEKLGDVK